MSKLGSWSTSGPSLLVLGLAGFVFFLQDVALWALTGRPLQPWFAHLPFLYVLAAGWLLYKTRGEPVLLKCLLASLAASFLLMSLGPAWQQFTPVWILQSVTGLVGSTCMVMGAWPSATSLDRAVAIASGLLFLVFPLLAGTPRRVVAFGVLAGVLYGVIASVSRHARESAKRQAAEGADPPLSNP